MQYVYIYIYIFLFVIRNLKQGTGGGREVSAQFAWQPPSQGFCCSCIFASVRNPKNSPELTEFQTALEQKQNQNKTLAYVQISKKKKNLCQMQVTRTKQEPQRTK